MTMNRDIIKNSVVLDLNDYKRMELTQDKLNKLLDEAANVRDNESVLIHIRKEYVRYGDFNQIELEYFRKQNIYLDRNELERLREKVLALTEENDTLNRKLDISVKEIVNLKEQLKKRRWKLW